MHQKSKLKKPQNLKIILLFCAVFCTIFCAYSIFTYHLFYEVTSAFEEAERVRAVCCDQPDETYISDIPYVFNETVLIVIPTNDSFWDDAQDFQKKYFGSRIKEYSDVTLEDKISSNIIVLATHDRPNDTFEDVFKVSSTITEKRLLHGPNDGSLEIIENPWNPQKTILLIEGYSWVGYLGASNLVIDDKTSDYNETYIEHIFLPPTQGKQSEDNDK